MSSSLRTTRTTLATVSRRLAQALVAVAAGLAVQAAGAQQKTTPTPGNTPMEPTQSGTGAATGAVIDRTASGALGVAPTASAPRDRAMRRGQRTDPMGATSGSRGRSEGSDVPASSRRGGRTGTGGTAGGAGTAGSGSMGTAPAGGASGNR